jgi:hypothetical protein
MFKKLLSGDKGLRGESMDSKRTKFGQWIHQRTIKSIQKINLNHQNEFWGI